MTDKPALGMPTRAKAREVWEAQPDPSVRTVAKALQDQGYQITFSTVGKWQRADWQEPKKPLKVIPKNNRNLPRNIVNNEIRKELNKEDPVTLAEASKAMVDGIEAAVTGSDLTDADIKRIEAAVARIKGMGVIELRDELEKRRLIMNIVLVEEATRKANMLVLIPKDTSVFVGVMTEDARAASAPLMPIAPTAAPGQQAIEGDFKVVSPVVLSPTKMAIDRFLAKENA